MPGSGTRTIVRDRAGSGGITQQLGTEQESKLQQAHRIQRLVMPPVHTIQRLVIQQVYTTQRLETRTIVRVMFQASNSKLKIYFQFNLLFSLDTWDYVG